MARFSDPPRKAPASKSSRIIDVNTDFGQSQDRFHFDGKDQSLLNFVSSVNIPCCVHDGEPAKVIADIDRAKKLGCAVGAHIGFPDPQNFGYKKIDMPADELEGWILLQLGAFASFCRVNNIEFGHVRPHGAMYAAFIDDEALAMTVARAIKRYDPWLILVAPIGPLAKKVEEEINIQIGQELYLGKRVDAEGALLLDRFSDDLQPQAVIEQVKQLIQEGSVTSDDGKVLPVTCKTIHLSSRLRGNILVAERIKAMLDAPVALTLETAGASGWL